MKPIFHGWRMVAACAVIATVSWSLGVFGIGVYLYEITTSRGWPLALISSAVGPFYLVGALSSMQVGRLIERHGPRPVIVTGAIGLAAGVAALGLVFKPWHVTAAFLLMGVGYAGLSTVALSATLAPWFERYQGRAVSTAMIGASLGGIIGTPLLVALIGAFGFRTATAVVAAGALLILLPIALRVLKHRPEDIGERPDGAAGVDAPSATDCNIAQDAPLSPRRQAAFPPRPWRRREALRTAALRSVIVSFGLALLVQVGFLTHHVTMLSPSLGAAAAAMTVAATGVAALLGRVALATWADRVDIRRVSAAVFGLAALSLCVLAVAIPMAATPILIATSVVYGLTVGNVTTLSPLIVRREFGAASFGSLYGAASIFIGLALAAGPAVFGLLHDAGGGYRLPLAVAAGLDAIAAVIVLRWRGGAMT